MISTMEYLGDVPVNRNLHVPTPVREVGDKYGASLASGSTRTHHRRWFVVKTAEAIKAGIQASRWNKNQMYSNLVRQTQDITLGEWESIAAEAGMMKAALDSHLDAKYGDAITIGASNVE
ncbi:hypothetical protein V1515DRAFT_464363 [Lipomyces mesembrius]